MISAENAQQIFAPQQETQRRPPNVSPFLWLISGVIIPALIAFGLSATDETQVVALVLAVIGALIIVTEPYWGLVFVVGLVFIRPEDTFPVLATMRLTLAVSALTLVTMWLRYFLAKTAIVRHPAVGMIVGFGAWVVISTFGRGYLVDAIAEIAKLVILFILTINLVRTPARFRSFATIILLLTAYVSLYSLYLYFTGDVVHRNDGIEVMQSRGKGSFGDPNDLCAVIVAGLGLLLPRLSEKRMASRLFVLALIPLFLTAIFYTNSRGGMVALVIVIGAYFIAGMKRKILGTVIGIVAVASLLAVAPSRMTNFDSEDESADARFAYWNQGLTFLRDNPLTGVGYAMFEDNNDGRAAHSSFVQCFGELGLPGFMFWMGCICFAFLPPRRARLLEGSDQNRSDQLAARLCLGGFLAAGFWISRAYVPVLYVLLAVPVAQQVVSNGQLRLQFESWKEVARAFAIVAAASFGVIILIKVMVMRFL